MTQIPPDLPDCREIRAAAEYGVDLWLLQANLQRTVAERLRRHQIILEAIKELKGAKRL